VYTVTDSGPDHSKRFRAEVALGAGAAIASGEGTSKKSAEMQAALAAFESLQAGAAKQP
jgi:ribonuclease-3